MDSLPQRPSESCLRLEPVTKRFCLTSRSHLGRVILPGRDRGAVIETGVPVAATLRGEVHEVPDGSEQVDAALLDVR